MLIDTQKIVYCSKPNWKIDFKISRFFAMKYATYTEPYNFVVHEADEDLQMEILELHCHLVSKWTFLMFWYKDLRLTYLHVDL